MAPDTRIQGDCCDENVNALAEAKNRADTDLWTPDYIKAWAGWDRHQAELRRGDTD